MSDFQETIKSIHEKHYQKPHFLYSKATTMKFKCIGERDFTFPSLSLGESKESKNCLRHWSSVHSPLMYLGCFFTLYTPWRSCTVTTPSPVLSSFWNALLMSSFLELFIGGCARKKDCEHLGYEISNISGGFTWVSDYNYTLITVSFPEF